MHQTKRKKFPVYQQGLQGADFRTLGHMECIRLKNFFPGIPAGVAGCKIQDPGTYGMHQTKNEKFLIYQQGLQGAEFRSLGHMECIRLKMKNSWYTSRGCGVQIFGRWDGRLASDYGKKYYPSHQNT